MLKALDWDKSDNLNKPPSHKTSRHLQDLFKAIAKVEFHFMSGKKQMQMGREAVSLTNLKTSSNLKRLRQ